MNIESIERFHMQNLLRIIKSQSFKNDLVEIENFIQQNYSKLHYHWGIKNKIKLAAERLITFHLTRMYPNTKLYNTPLSSDVAFITDDAVLNIDCKTIDLSGNSGDKIYIQCEENQANFENILLYPKVNLNNTNNNFEGVTFYPALDKFFNNLPVLSFFIFINYYDDGTKFEIRELEICCLPHDECVKKSFNSDIIQNFKTFKYLKELQALKFNAYYCPRTNIDSSWVEFNVGNTVCYFDSKMTHPFDSNKSLIWRMVSGKWHVMIGGNTIRVRKNKIKNRVDLSSDWLGWEKVAL
jgi:uncharacterized pyridoxamine 5'-phosphate oxidase family protein